MGSGINGSGYFSSVTTIHADDYNFLYTDVHFDSCHWVLKDGFRFVPERTETFMFGRIYTPKTKKVKIKSVGSRTGMSVPRYPRFGLGRPITRVQIYYPLPECET